MPEGHSIFVAAAEQNKLFAGDVVEVTSPQGRFHGARAVTGKKLREVEGIGKHLFYHFAGKAGGRKAGHSIVHVHLGRLGRFKYWEGEPGEAREACRMRIVSPTAAVDLSGPTACEIIPAEKREAILARLGPDPLREDANPSKAWDRIRVSRKPIGALLLDQSVIAGLGNIFRAEILFRLKIHPAVPGNELSKPQFSAIWKDSVAMLKQGVKYGWIITTTPKAIGRPLAKARGGRNGDRFWVYHRNVCRVCGGKIEVLTMGGRAIYFCPQCQKQ